MTRAGAAADLRFEETRPEPARFWIRWAPRRWPGPEAPFVDLARGRMARTALRAARPRTALPAGPSDTIYVPPVAEEHASWRDDLLRRIGHARWPARVQILAGQVSPPAAPDLVVDLTAALLERDLEALAAAPAGAAAVWPLLAGLTDDPELARRGCRRLRTAGVTALQPVVPALSPAQRRRLSEAGGERAYHALFHGPEPRVHGLARAAVEAGLEPWAHRPALPSRGRKTRNRRLAEHLAQLGEWWLLLERPEGRAQALFRAARWVDEERRDVVAVAAEGNLSVVDWLEPAVRREIERFAAGEGREVIHRMAVELGAGSGRDAP